MLLIMILLVATQAELYSMEKIETIKAQVEDTRERMKKLCVSYQNQKIEDLLEKCQCCSCICF